MLRDRQIQGQEDNNSSETDGLPPVVLIHRGIQMMLLHLGGNSCSTYFLTTFLVGGNFLEVSKLIAEYTFG